MDTRPYIAARVAATAVFAFHGLALAQWFVRIPDVKIQAGLDDGQLGVALLGSAVGSVSTMPVAGALTSRFGSRNVTAAFALLFCVCFLLPSFATSQWTLFAGLVGFGMAVGGIDVAFNSQASTVERRYGQVLMSGFHGAWSLANLAGAVVATPIVALGIPPAIHLSPTGVLAGMAILASTFWFLEDDPHTETAPVRAVARFTPALLAIGTIAGLSLLVEGAVADWSGIYLRDVLGASPASAGIAFAAFSLTMAASRLTGDWISARYEPRAVLLTGSVVSAMGLVVALATTDRIVTIVGFAICGAGIGTTFPLALSAASKLPGQASGAAIAAVATMGYAGFLAGPPLIGTVSDMTSSLATGVGMAIVASLVMAVLTRAVPSGQESATQATDSQAKMIATFASRDEDQPRRRMRRRDEADSLSAGGAVGQTPPAMTR
jgi:MFS family permease